MAETTADVRRDIELTRERMTSTLAQLEKKLNLTQVVRDNPWPALGVAFGAGLLLSGSRADVKAAAATTAATKGAGSRLAPALDDIVGNLMQGLGAALQGHVDTLLDEVKRAIGAPTGPTAGAGNGQAHGFADAGMAASGAQAGGGLGDVSGGSTGGNGATDTWAPHSADLSRSGGTGGLTPSSAGSQQMPRAD